MSNTTFATIYRPYSHPEVDNGGEVTQTDFSCQADTDIYALIDKYGIKSLMAQNRPEHELYIDTSVIPRNMTLQDALKMKKDFDEYFKQMPATVRKVFGDNADNMYLRYKQGEFDELIKHGILSKEQIEIQKQAIKEERRNIYHEIDNELKMEGGTNELKETLSKYNTLVENQTLDKGN